MTTFNSFSLCELFSQFQFSFFANFIQLFLILKIKCKIGICWYHFSLKCTSSNIGCEGGFGVGNIFRHKKNTFILNSCSPRPVSLDLFWTVSLIKNLNKVTEATRLNTVSINNINIPNECVFRWYKAIELN